MAYPPVNCPVGLVLSASLCRSDFFRVSCLYKATLLLKASVVILFTILFSGANTRKLTPKIVSNLVVKT